MDVYLTKINILIVPLARTYQVGLFILARPVLSESDWETNNVLFLGLSFRHFIYNQTNRTCLKTIDRKRLSENVNSIYYYFVTKPPILT